MTEFSEKNIWALLKEYHRTVSILANQFDSFDNFIERGMQTIINQNRRICDEKGYSLEYGQVYVSNPHTLINNELVDIYPDDARRLEINYESTIYIDIIETNGEKVVCHSRVPIGKIPIMVKSKTCNLSRLTSTEQVEQNECSNDLGGYFIISGHERVIISQMRSVYNHVFVLASKPSTKYRYIAETRSMSVETGHSVLVKAMVCNESRHYYFHLPCIKVPIEAGIVFKAMGIFDLENIIGLDEEKYSDFADKIREAIRYIYRDSIDIKTKTEACQYIAEYAKHEIDKENHVNYSKQIVETEVLPHFGISGTVLNQAIFLGMMLRKLILTNLGKRKEDDRDNIANKRVETTGDLFYEIFRNIIKRHNNTVIASLKKVTKSNIIPNLSKMKVITKGFHQCLATGNWSVQKNAKYQKVGVSQVLDRMTYMAALSHLRRVIIPIGREGKNVPIRQIHPSSYGYLCPCETPEGKNIGLVLNMALSTKITRGISNVDILSSLTEIKIIREITNLSEIKKLSIIFLNGTIIGFTKNPEKVVEKVLRLRNFDLLDREVSITFDPLDFEVRIYSDEGRMSRPLLNVINNKVELKPKKSYNWNSLIKDGIIQYFDASEIENYVVARDIFALKQKPLDTIDEDITKDITEKIIDSESMEETKVITEKPLQQIIEYDFCEIHPSLMLGVVAALIPFPDHNQSPRNCYQCLWENEKVLMGNGTFRKISEIKIGDEVISVDPVSCKRSRTKVIHAYVKNTEKKIVKITTISNRSVVCTEDHPILTLNGWKMAETVSNEFICVFPKSCQDEFFLCLNIRKCKYVIRNGAIFIPVKSIESVPNVKIADITTESKNHSFITEAGICVHNSSMGKQAIGVPLYSYRNRVDTVMHVLSYPQKPLTFTKTAELLKINDMPSGINVIVAILTLTGYNQEDSIIIKKSAVERGLFMISSLHAIKETERKKESYCEEKICLPPRSSEPTVKPTDKEYFKRKVANYNLLDENGIVRRYQDSYVSFLEKTKSCECDCKEKEKCRCEKGIFCKYCKKCEKKVEKCVRNATRVKKGDVIIGKVLRVLSKDGEEKLIDISRIVEDGEEGVIDNIRIVNHEGIRKVSIVLRDVRFPICGDKLASRSAQKGTIGRVMEDIDMPFNSEGIIPDIVINPCCIPSRMTIGQLIECVLGKYCSIKGEFGDATPFTENSRDIADKIYNKFVGMGFSGSGFETLTSGITGELLPAKVFMGPTYYQRLKHMATDKMHARATGQMTTLTRQPTEGRARDGGLRVGEMESDTLKALGVSGMINERLFQVSDPFMVPVCKDCEIVTTAGECHACGGSSVYSCNIPYASNLFFNEIRGLGIKIGYGVK